MTRLNSVVICFALLLVTVPGHCSAHDLVLSYSVAGEQPTSTLWQGTVRIEVRNISGGPVRNVDVRLAVPGIDALERGLLQLGGIAAGQSRAADVRVVLDATSRTPLLWKIDYDDGTGAHRQVVLPGTRLGL